MTIDALETSLLEAYKTRDIWMTLETIKADSNCEMDLDRAFRMFLIRPFVSHHPLFEWLALNFDNSVEEGGALYKEAVDLVVSKYHNIWEDNRVTNEDYSFPY